jgi:hypothetical protein
MRLLQRAVFCEMGEAGSDRVWLFDAGNDPNRAAAMDAGGHVDVEHALRRCAQDIDRRRSSGERSSLLAWVDSPSLASRLPRPAGVNCARRLALGAKDAVEAREVGAWWRHQRRQLGDEVDGLELDVRGAVLPRRLELVADPALRRDR